MLVTGASRGIGAAVARAFAGAGDRVAVHYGANADLAHEVAASLPGDGPRRRRAPTSRTPRRSGAWSTRRRQASAASTCSSTTPASSSDHPIAETTYEEWQRGWEETLGVNLVGAANVTWCAVQHMLRGGRGGRIVNVSSRGAFRGEPDAPAYGASKAGLIAFGQSLARALGGHGISVVSVAPGFTETDMAAEELAGPRGDARRDREPVRPRRDRGGGRGRGALPRLAGGRVRERRRARRERRVVPAHVTAGYAARSDRSPA